MDPTKRPLFNQHYDDAFFRKYMDRLESKLGNFPFRVAETPLSLTADLRDRLAKYA